MNEQFDIKILKLNWIEGGDERLDLCLHGNIYIRIGDEIISNEENGQFTLSSTGLYLLRSIESDYTIGEYASQLIPCCGHFFMRDNDQSSVAILGCSHGLDWKIEHEGNMVKYIIDGDKFGVIDKEDYKNKVLKFVDEIEQFYWDSKPKKLPKDEYDRNGYLTFWKEWKNLRRKYI